MSLNKDMYFICCLLKDPTIFKDIVINKVAYNYLVKEAAEIFKYINDFFQEYGKVPSIQTVEKKFESFYEDPPENIHYYIKYLKNREKFNLIKKTYNDLYDVIANAEDLEKSISICESLLMDTTSRLSLELSEAKVMDITQNAISRYSKYEERKLGIDGVKTPWDMLTNEIFGWQKGDLNTILGESGLGKSWGLLLCLISAFESGKKVLLFTEEMTIIQLASRFDSMISKLPYELFRKANLSSKQEDSYKEFLTKLSEDADNDVTKPFIIIQDIGDKGTDAILSAIRIFKPDIVGIDGAYLFSENYDWKAISDLTKSLKKIAQNTMTPILVTNQKAEGTDKAAYSASFIRDSSYVIVMFQEPDRKDLPLMSFKLIKCRDIKKSLCWESNWDFDSMDFTQLNNAIYNAEDYNNYI